MGIKPDVAVRMRVLEAEVRLGKEFALFEPVYMDHPSDRTGEMKRQHFTLSAIQPHSMVAPNAGKHTRCALLLDAAAHTYSFHGDGELDVCPSCLHCFAVEELASEE